MIQALRVDWSQVWGIFMRNYSVYAHTWALSLVPRFFEPLFYLLGMGLGLGAFIGRTIEGQEYISFVAPAMVAVSAMNGSSFEVTYTMYVKRTRKIYDAFLCTPVMVPDIVLGELIWATTRSVLYGGIFYLFLIAFTLAGFPIISDWTSVITVIPIIALTGFLFACLGTIFNALIPIIELFAAYFTLFITPLFLFSGTFFPLTKIPYGETIAWFTPLFHAVKVTRALIQGTFAPEHWINIAWLIVASLVCYCIAVYQMRKSIVV